MYLQSGFDELKFRYLKTKLVLKSLSTCGNKGKEKNVQPETEELPQAECGGQGDLVLGYSVRKANI